MEQCSWTIEECKPRLYDCRGNLARLQNGGGDTGDSRGAATTGPTQRKTAALSFHEMFSSTNSAAVSAAAAAAAQRQQQHIECKRCTSPICCLVAPVSTPELTPSSSSGSSVDPAATSGTATTTVHSNYSPTSSASSVSNENATGALAANKMVALRCSGTHLLRCSSPCNKTTRNRILRQYLSKTKRSFRFVQLLGQGTYGVCVSCREEMDDGEEGGGELVCMKLTSNNDAFEHESYVLTLMRSQLFLGAQCPNVCVHRHSFSTVEEPPHERSKNAWRALWSVKSFSSIRTKVERFGHMHNFRGPYGCIVTEHIDGGILGDYVLNHSFSTNKWLCFAFQLCYGLYTMHNCIKVGYHFMTLLHRDISMGNIMLQSIDRMLVGNETSNAVPVRHYVRIGDNLFNPYSHAKHNLKWIDFGMSRLVKRFERINRNRTSIALVTLCSRPPELFFFTEKRIGYNAASDVWSLGSILLGMAFSGTKNTRTFYSSPLLTKHDSVLALIKSLEQALEQVVRQKNSEVSEEDEDEDDDDCVENSEEHSVHRFSTAVPGAHRQWMKCVWKNVDISIDVENCEEVATYLAGMCIVLGGAPTKQSWPGVQHTLLYSVLHRVFDEHRERLANDEPLQKRIRNMRETLHRRVGEHGVQLLSGMLQWDPRARPTMQQVMHSRAFEPLLCNLDDVTTSHDGKENQKRRKVASTSSSKHNNNNNNGRANQNNCHVWTSTAEPSDAFANTPNFGTTRLWPCDKPMLSTCLFDGQHSQTNPLPYFESTIYRFFYCTHCRTLRFIESPQIPGSLYNERRQCCFSEFR